MTQSLGSPAEIAYTDDLAVTEFRAFHRVASLHVDRVNSPAARGVIREILEDLTKVLQQNQKLL